MAFTTIDAATSWQDLAIAQEIRVAFNKRRTACGLSLMDEPTEDLTVSSFILAAQTGIEEMATQFANPAATLAGQISLPANYATLAAFMAGAGLTASGYWRRIADGGTQPETWTSYGAAGWSYGKIQDLDLAGPWLFKDLMTALTHMTRMVVDAATSVNDASDDFSALMDAGDPPTAEATGNVTLTITAGKYTGESIGMQASKWLDDPHAVWPTDDHIDCYVRMLRLRASYPRSATVTFVGLIDSDSTETFSSVTGIANSQIGTTIAVVTTDKSSLNGYAWCWLWTTPSSGFTPAWSTISSVIDWGGMQSLDLVIKGFSISPSNRVCVLDLTIVDGP